MPKRRQHGEGSLFQRKRDGLWVARIELGWTDAGKRDRREFTGETPEQAIDKRRAFLRNREDGFTAPAGRADYAGAWVTHWLEFVARPRIAESTYKRTYLHHVRDLIAPYFAKVRLPDLCEEDIERWHAQLGRRPRGQDAGAGDDRAGAPHPVHGAERCRDPPAAAPQPVQQRPAAAAGPGRAGAADRGRGAPDHGQVPDVAVRRPVGGGDRDGHPAGRGAAAALARRAPGRQGPVHRGPGDEERGGEAARAAGPGRRGGAQGVAQGDGAGPARRPGVHEAAAGGLAGLA